MHVLDKFQVDAFVILPSGRERNHPSKIYGVHSSQSDVHFVEIV